MSDMIWILPITIGILIFYFYLRSVERDRERISEFINVQHGRLIWIKWSLFGLSFLRWDFFGLKNERIYKVRYLDFDQNVHLARCRISLWAVSLVEDQVVRHYDKASIKSDAH